jgi:hypothetical protein
VGAEEAIGAVVELLHRIDHVEVLGRPIGDLERLLVGGQLGQGTLQPVGIARQLHAGGVGQVLALPIHGHLDEAGEDRGQHRDDDADDHDDGRAAAAVAAAPGSASHAAPEGRPGDHVREQGHRSDQDADEQAEADVVVGHVRKLVTDDPLQLFPVELVQEPGRDGHAGVLRVATRREGIGRGVVDDEDPGFRHVRREAHLPHHVEKLRQVLLRDLPRA